jgi:hypothetical protein
MTERKPRQETWESFAERKIREAQAEGAFDGLPGFGQPIPGIDQPLNPDWWLRDKLRREELNVLPPILEARLEAEKTLQAIGTLTNEAAVRRRLEQLNEKIRTAHFSHIAGPSAGVAPVDIEAVIADWRRKREASGVSDQ